MERIQNLEDFYKHCDWCVETEPKLKPVFSRFGYPPLWHREANFATLIRTILEQQVSLAAAESVYEKLKNKVRFN